LPIPDYQSFFLPLLLLASDGNVHSVREAIESLSNQFNLSDGERKALLPSGTQRIVDNRVSWARTYLTEADSIPELKVNIQEAVKCHFEEDEYPLYIRLHFVKDEIIVL
jgi:restriction endonuclease Mrr